MKIHIHRGQNQIGGSIIEIASENTRIIFDVGINLDEGDEVEVPQIEGLFCGDPSYDAVIISHYHADHIGLLKYVLEEIPIYMGLFDFFTSITIGVICCPGDNIDSMEQAIMNDAKLENEDLVHTDSETDQDKEIDKTKDI